MRKSAAAVVLFLAVLWAPLIGMFFGSGSDSHVALPKMDRHWRTWIDSGAAFTAYVDEHFGFRRELIAAQALLKIRVLGVSSSAEAVVGKEGWLFYSGDHAMDAYRGTLPFSDRDVALWIDLFQRRRDALRTQGALVLFVIAPDKQSIYPEFLPTSAGPKASYTPLDRLMQAASLPIVDLRRPLLEVKSRGLPVFNRTDTHWNGHGVYAAYTAIAGRMSRDFPDIHSVPESAIIHDSVYASGDLARIVGLNGFWMERMETSRPSQSPSPEAPGRKLLVFGDSFSPPLIPFLAQHFGTTVALPLTAFDPVAIAAQHPDLVIIEMVERKLNVTP